MLRIFRIMPLRVAADKRIGRDPLVNHPDKGAPLTPVSVRFVAAVGFDKSNPLSKRREVIAQSPTKRLPHSSESMAKPITLSDYFRFSFFNEVFFGSYVSPVCVTFGLLRSVFFKSVVSRVSEAPANSRHRF